jgi:hypothetical protein
MRELSERRLDLPGPTIRIDCRGCGKAGASAETIESVHHLHAFNVPLFTIRYATIQCANCDRKYFTPLRATRLGELSRTQLGQVQRYGFPGIEKPLAILALALCFVSVYGLAMGALALYVTRGTHAWPRQLSAIATCIATIVTLLGLVSRG